MVPPAHFSQLGFIRNPPREYLFSAKALDRFEADIGCCPCFIAGFPRTAAGYTGRFHFKLL